MFVAATAVAEKASETARKTAAAPACSVRLADAPTKSRFLAERGFERLPEATRDTQVIAVTAAWLRWHGFSYEETARILSRRGLVPETARRGKLGPDGAKALILAYRPIAYAKADQLDPRRTHTAGEAARLLAGAGLDETAIAIYLNERGIPWNDPKKTAKNNAAEDTVTAVQGAAGKRAKSSWTAKRVVVLLESPERAGAVYHPDFEDEEKMATVLGDAYRIRREALEQAHERLRASDKIDPALAMSPLSDDEQNTLFLAMNYLRYRAVLERERWGRWAVSEDDPALKHARHHDDLAQLFCDVLMRSNARLVRNVAKSFMLQYELADLLQEGQFGLRRAIDTYDVRRKVRPSSWMMPIVQRWFFRMIKTDNTQSRAGARSNVSLDHLGENSESTGHFEAVDGTAVDALEALTRSESLARLQVALDALGKRDPRKREILELRFGLFDGDKWELKKIGDRIGVTRERVRQIESDALAELAALMAKVSGDVQDDR